MHTRRTEREQVDMPNGHYIKHYVFGPVIKPGIRSDKIYFHWEFSFNCIKMPTSWSLLVTFSRERNESLCCETYLVRIDQMLQSVNVQFWTKIRTNPVCFDVAYVQHFISGMKPRENDFNSEIVIQANEARKLYDQDLHVEFFFIVYGCHSAQDITDSSVGRDETNAIHDNTVLSDTAYVD